MSSDSNLPASLTSITGDTFSDAQIDALYDIVVAGPKQQNPTMREVVFRDHFLPVLTGVVENPELLRIYMQGVAGFNVGLNVVDDAGNFLFEVPPLYSSDHIKVLPESDDTPTFGTILEHVQLMRHRSAIQSKELFKTGLMRRILASHRKGYLPTANEKKWIAIFKRYGYEITSTTLTKEEFDAITNTDSLGGNSLIYQSDNASEKPAKPANDFEIVGEF